MSLERRYLTGVELHAVEEIRAVLEEGLDANAPIRGRTPMEWLIEMYTRSARFSDCFAALLEAGARCDDQRLAAVLLDDADMLRAALSSDPAARDRRLTLTCAFTPLVEVSLLHVAAEFGRLQASRTLLDLGLAVDARAPVDGYGQGGHTALFHTVNSNGNHARPVMDLLLDAGARPDLFLSGLTWGKGFPWATTLYDLTPISYAQAGLLPQMHRDEVDIYDNVERLLAAAARPRPPRSNVPNEYLRSS